MSGMWADLNIVVEYTAEARVFCGCPPEKLHPTGNSTRGGDSAGIDHGSGQMRCRWTATSSDRGNRRRKDYLAGENVCGDARMNDSPKSTRVKIARSCCQTLCGPCEGPHDMKRR